MNVTLISLESSASCSSAALLHLQGEQPRVTELVSDQAHGHAEQLLPMIDQLLESAGLGRSDLSGIVFGQGPGGFTGLRIAAGMAQGLGLGLGIPVFPVTSLLAVAETVRPAAPGTLIVSLLDARMQEAFLAAYQDTGNDELHQVQAPCLVAGHEIPQWIEDLRTRRHPGASGHDASRRMDGLALTLPMATGESPVPYTTAGEAPIVLVGSGVQVCPEVAHVAGVTCCADAQPRAALMARIGLRAWLAGRFIPADQAAPLYVRDKVAFTTRERETGQGGNPRAIPLSSGQSAQADASATSPVSETSQARLRAIAAVRQQYMIRPMTEEDIEAVVRIECTVQSHPWTAGNFRDSLKAGYEAWVVCHEQQIIAFSLQLMAPDVAHLLLIGVLPNWQGTGIGTGLLAWGEDRLLQRKLDSQMLEVRPSNTRAIAFYRRCGYEQIGVRKGYYPAGRGTSEDAWVLQKAVVS